MTRLVARDRELTAELARCSQRQTSFVAVTCMCRCRKPTCKIALTIEQATPRGDRHRRPHRCPNQPTLLIVAQHRRKVADTGASDDSVADSTLLIVDRELSAALALL